MADVLAVNPWIYDFAAFDLWAKPLGFLYILSLLKKQGITIDFIDLLDRWHPLLTDNLSHYRPKDNIYGCGKFYAEEIPKPEAYSNISRKYKRYGIPPYLLENYLAKKHLNLNLSLSHLL